MRSPSGRIRGTELILAASKSDSEASNDKNALRLHCCCVIVQISPAQQKLNGSAKVSSGHSGKGPTNRKPVCICNAQYRWQQELLLKKAGAQDQSSAAAEAERKKQAKKEESAQGQDGSRTVGTHLAFRNDDQSPLLLSKKHGSLDRLLQLSQISSSNNGSATPCAPVTRSRDAAKHPRPRHDKLTRKVKSTESALPVANAIPSSSDSTAPAIVGEHLQTAPSADRKMDVNQMQHLQYLQRAQYPIPPQQQQKQSQQQQLQASHQVILQPVTATQQGGLQNANDEYNRKLFHQQQKQQQQQKRLETCPQTVPNTIPISERRHHHHPNQYLPQYPSNITPTSGNILKAPAPAKKQSLADAKELLLLSSIAHKQALGPEVGKAQLLAEPGERREKKIIWSNHVHHKSSANGSTSMATQNFQLQKNPSYPTLQQYTILPHHQQPQQQPPIVNGACNRVYQQPVSSALVIDNNGREWFDRSQRQRQSSRSVGEAENIIYQTIGAVAGSSNMATSAVVESGKGGAGHHRHSSGPSEMSLLKEDIAKLLSQLSLDAKNKKGAGEARGRSVEFVVKDDSSLGQSVQKRPVTRQSSGPGDVTALRNDLIEWLTRQQATINVGAGGGGGQQIVNKEDLYAKVVKPSQNSGISLATTGATAPPVQVAAPPVPKPRKRHSVGHDGDHSSERSRKQSPQTAIQKFEIPKEMLAQLELNSSFVDLQLRRPSKSTSHIEGGGGKVLRHSASEVVTTSTGHPDNNNNGHKQHTSRSSSSSKSKRHHTQRSATVSEMVLPSSSSAGRQATASGERVRPHSSKKQSVQRRSTSSISSSMPKCTDPNCPFLPICTDPDCCYLANCYDRVRYTQHIPRCRCKKCTPKCLDYRCNSLPRCMDSKCPATSGSTSGPSLIKCNSLPRCAETTTSSFIHNNYLQDNCAEFPLVPQNNSQRRYNGSRSSLLGQDSGKSRPLSNGHATMGRHQHANKTEHGAHASHGNTNGKLVKSVSAASLNSRRRRHKTVHFGDNLLREVCQNRKFMKSEYVNVPATTTSVVIGSGGAKATPLQPNIEMLYNFIEGVLSSWVDDDYDDIDAGGSSSLSRWNGAESDPERGGVLKPLHRCNRARIQTIRRVVGEAAQLKGSAKLGNQRYRHRHWRGTAKDCNERFLRKVNFFDFHLYVYAVPLLFMSVGRILVMG